ncbi:MAG: G8 domain-containing protein [Opitutales bacterium]
MLAFCVVTQGLNAQNEVLGHPMVHSLFPDALVTKRTVQGGNWSNPAVWDANTLPTDGDRIVIEEGHAVVVDYEVPEELMTLHVKGDLSFNKDVHTQLTVDTMLVDSMGSLTMGKEGAPISRSVTAKIVIKDYNNEGIITQLNEDGSAPIDYDPYQVGQGLIAKGRVDMEGATRVHGGTLSQAPSALDDRIYLDFKAKDWEVGDKIVIAGTTRDGLGDEVREVAKLKNSKRTIVLDRPLELDHHLPTHSKEGLILKVHVINLTRNVWIETDASGRDPFPAEPVDGVIQYNRRGHLMFMHNSDVRLKLAGFYGLGRSNKTTRAKDTFIDEATGEITLLGTNPRGRYAVHFHMAGFDRTIEVTECAVDGSPGWGFVNHSSRVDFYRNVAYNARGASFVTEAGDELGSFIENISIRNDADEDQSGNDLRFQKRKFSSDRADENEFGFGGHGFWYQGINIIAKRNVASGAGREAMSIYPLPLLGRVSDTIPVEEVREESAHLHASDDVSITAMPVLSFEDEIVYGSNIALMVGEHRPDFYSRVKNFVGWSVQMGLSTNYSDFVSYEDITLIGDLDDPMGLGAFAHHGTGNVDFINPHMEGFALGLQMPRGGNSELGSELSNPEAALKLSFITNGYFNNLINLHFPLVRAHTPVKVEITNPTFGTLAPDAVSRAITALGEIDTNNDLNIDSSNTDSNGFKKLKELVDGGSITKQYNYLLHDTSKPENSGGTTVHKKDILKPVIFTVDYGEGGKYHLMMEDMQNPQHVPYQADLYIPDDYVEGDEIGKWGIPIAYLDKTNREIATLFQSATDPDNPYHNLFGKMDHYPIGAHGIGGMMFPPDFEQIDRFEPWDDGFNVVAVRIDDLEDYKLDLVDPNLPVLLFDFEYEGNRLKYRQDKPAAWNAFPMEYKYADFNAYSGTGKAMFLDGKGDAIDYTLPYRHAHKTFSWIADLRPLETTSGVIYEWSAGDAFYQISMDGGELLAKVQTSSSAPVKEIRGGSLTAGHWHQIAFNLEYSLGRVFLYLDGVLIGSSDVDTITVMDRGIARIGRGIINDDVSNAYRGFVDNLRVLERSFTVLALEEYYNETRIQTPEEFDPSLAGLDVTDIDVDGDDVRDLDDVFPANEDETLDSDGDGWGDASDPEPFLAFLDSDGDRVPDASDPFPSDPTEWSDIDGDWTGDFDDSDADGDGVQDVDDALPFDATEQVDTDGDGVGDNSDAFVHDPMEWRDTDKDGYGDNIDALDHNPDEWKDSDNDGWGDGQDNHIYSPAFALEENILPNPGAEDGATDWKFSNTGSSATINLDFKRSGNASFILNNVGDGTARMESTGLEVSNPAGLKRVTASGWVRLNKIVKNKEDKVRIGIDFIGGRVEERIILVENREWTNFSFDYFSDDWTGIDRFFISNDLDNLVVHIDDLKVSVNNVESDIDSDGIDDYADNDDDGDGYLDGEDWFPNSASEWADTDNDGTGNNEDTDDDGDDLLDTEEIAAGLDPLDALDADLDYDQDGQTNRLEVRAGTDIFDSMSRFILSTVNVLENGDVRLEWAGGDTQSFYIEYSNDLMNWYVLPDSVGVTVSEGYTDISVGGAAARYYRVVLND